MASRLVEARSSSAGGPSAVTLMAAGGAGVRAGGRGRAQGGLHSCLLPAACCLALLRDHCRQPTALHPTPL